MSRRSTLALVGVIGAMATPSAIAHPLGNFSVNQYLEVGVTTGDLRLHYVLDRAEVPTYQARERADSNADGVVDAAEQTVERDGLAREIVDAITVTAGGVPVTPSLQSAVIRYVDGSGGLPVTRLDLLLAAPRGSGTIAVANSYAVDRVGWREISVSAAPGIAVSATTASRTNITAGLTSYDTTLGQSRPDIRSATIDAAPGSGGLEVLPYSVDAGPSVAASRTRDRFGGLLADGGPVGLGAILIALAAAALFGMLHAMTPGHGKSMVAAYLIGSRGTTRHALGLGATVAVSHTAGVFALGLATLGLSQWFVPEQVYPWLSLGAGVLVVALGLTALRDRWLRRRRAVTDGTGHGHDHGGPPRATTTITVELSITVTGMATITVTVTITVTATITAWPHDHAEGSLSPRSILAMGVSGGLLPCPSALVVLLAATALNRVALGVVLVIAFSFGLAAVVSGVGILALQARRLFARLPSDHGRLIMALPVASALFIITVGIVMTLRAVPKVF